VDLGVLGFNECFPYLLPLKLLLFVGSVAHLFLTVTLSIHVDKCKYERKGVMTRPKSNAKNKL